MLLKTRQRLLLAAPPGAVAVFLALWCAHHVRAQVTPRWEDPWRDALFDRQASLATTRPAAHAPPVDDLASQEDPAVMMWELIYHAIALDRLGRRDAAISHYRRALRVHAHPVAKSGLAAPLSSLRHLDELARDLAAGSPFVPRRYVLAGVRTVAFEPKERPRAPGYPLVIRVGHPRHLDGMIHQLIEVRRHLPADEPVLLATGDTLRLDHDMDVGSPALLASVPPRFKAWVDELMARYPVDPSRVYLTGFSFDGVWAWILGYADQNRYAAVAALSAVSYPPPIQDGVRRGLGPPTCVLRGEQDSLYPRLLQQEQATGRQLERNDPRNVFRILPGVDHAGVWRHAGVCLEWLMRQKRVSPDGARP